MSHPPYVFSEKPVGLKEVNCLGPEFIEWSKLPIQALCFTDHAEVVAGKAECECLNRRNVLKAAHEVLYVLAKDHLILDWQIGPITFAGT